MKKSNRSWYKVCGVRKYLTPLSINSNKGGAIEENQHHSRVRGTRLTNNLGGVNRCTVVAILSGTGTTGLSRETGRHQDLARHKGASMS